MQTVYTHQTVDGSTGEVLETKFLKKEVKTTEEFVLLYIKHIGLLAQLPKYQLQTLLCLAPCIEWNTGEFTIDSRTMQKVTECTNLSPKTIRNSITKLKKLNIVQRVNTNWYKLNPDLFWKGSELERQKSFSLTYKWEITE